MRNSPGRVLSFWLCNYYHGRARTSLNDTSGRDLRELARRQFCLLDAECGDMGIDSLGYSSKFYNKNGRGRQFAGSWRLGRFWAMARYFGLEPYSSSACHSFYQSINLQILNWFRLILFVTVNMHTIPYTFSLG